HRRAGSFLPGGDAARQDSAVRKAVAGIALAEGTRVGGGEVVRRRRRTVCAGQERRPARQGTRYAAAQVGRLAEDLAEAAPQRSHARSTATADRRGEEGSRPCLRLRAPALARRGRGRHPPDVLLSLG